MERARRMPVNTLTSAQALDFVRRRAAVLDATANAVNPFAGSAWMLHFIEHVAGGGWTVVAPELGADGESVMLLYEQAAAPGRYSGLVNYYASLFSPLYSTARDRAAAIAGLVKQVTSLRPRPATVNFAPLDAQAPDTAALAEAMTAQGWYVRRYFCFGNWYLPCEGMTFDVYMAERDSQLRNTYARKSKKFLATGQLHIATSPDEIDAAMDAYDAVYAKSWKQPEPYPGFVRGWARICARNGWLRLGVASIGGLPIAVQFWFTVERRAYIFKLAYDEEQQKWSAGTVLSAHMFRYALEVDRVVEMDYLTGDDPYKRSWMTHRRERIGLMACNKRSFKGLWAACAEWAGHARARLRQRPVPVV